MKLLAEISEDSLGLGSFKESGSDFTWRKSARAILINEAGYMAVQYLQTYGFHKLPGGGVDDGESYESACLREIKEEVGCDARIEQVVGATIEYRNTEKRIQISHCFAATVEGELGTPHLEAGEIEEGQITLWLKPEEALAKMRADIPKKFEGHFILKREISFLEAYLDMK
ncbi:MAG TPA: NUDIX domain-containing protein [Candidatus Paceibacterota bacterium]